MLKRKLTKQEIELLISDIKPQKGIPNEIALSIVKYNKENIRKQLLNQEIYPKLILSLKKMISKQYRQSLIDPGESVGVLSAQSIGEKQTQTTLDSFHKAGSAGKSSTTGVPRAEEILNATKDPKTVNCFIYFLENNNTISEVRELIGDSLVEITLKKITKSFEINIDKKNEKWYKSFQILYSDTFTKYTDCITVKINMDILYEYKLDLEKICNVINEKYSDIFCIFSPDIFGQIDIFVDTESISLPEDRLVYINQDNASAIYLEEVVQPIVENIIIVGIPGVKNIYFNTDNVGEKKWMVETDGGNFKKLLGHPLIDKTRTKTNHMWNIYHTLGIEATREFLIQECMSIMSGINKCHVELLIDKMTYSGTIASVSRYSMRHEEEPLQKCSFEETMDNLQKAGIYGQEDSTKGVSSSIMCGKIARMGTGKCDLLMDIDMLENRYA